MVSHAAVDGCGVVCIVEAFAEFCDRVVVSVPRGVAEIQRVHGYALGVETLHIPADHICVWSGEYRHIITLVCEMHIGDDDCRVAGVVIFCKTEIVAFVFVSRKSEVCPELRHHIIAIYIVSGGRCNEHLWILFF